MGAFFSSVERQEGPHDCTLIMNAFKHLINPGACTAVWLSGLLVFPVLLPLCLLSIRGSVTLHKDLLSPFFFLFVSFAL